MYAVFGRRGLQIITFAVLLFAAFLAEAVFISRTSTYKDIRNPEARHAFLSELSVSVDEETLTETEITVPLEFSDVYLQYNLLQIEAGYDLTDYKGKRVTRYTYELENEENILINLLCYGGRVIGGDISATALDGAMLPLKKQENTNYVTNETG